MSDKTNTHGRRKFLSLSLLAGAGLVAGKVNANTNPDSGEKVKMLTPDGKLVEVDKTALIDVSKKTASKKDILRWIHAENK